MTLKDFLDAVMSVDSITAIQYDSVERSIARRVAAFIPINDYDGMYRELAEREFGKEFLNTKIKDIQIGDVFITLENK